MRIRATRLQQSTANNEHAVEKSPNGHLSEEDNRVGDAQAKIVASSSAKSLGRSALGGGRRNDELRSVRCSTPPLQE